MAHNSSVSPRSTPPDLEAWAEGLTPSGGDSSWGLRFPRVLPAWPGQDQGVLWLVVWPGALSRPGWTALGLYPEVR